MRANRMVRYHRHGDPGVLILEEVPLDAPKSDEVQVRHTAIGVNFLDIIQRSGADRSLSMPASIGVEGAGVVEVADQSGMFNQGDRVAYVGGPPGAYALRRNYPAHRLIKLPEWIEDEVAAAMLFKGLTAEYLINRCVPIKEGQTVLFHAAAGGVGSIACQWLKARGARVIGTVGSEEKFEQAHRNGCDHVLLSHDQEFVSKVRDFSGGVDVVYDSIGKTTFNNSLDCLRQRGTMVSFGASSGPPPEISVSDLVTRGSLFLTRPSIAHYVSEDAEYQNAAHSFFGAISEKVVAPSQITRVLLQDAHVAHTRLESRTTMGSVVLIPEEV